MTRIVARLLAWWRREPLEPWWSERLRQERWEARGRRGTADAGPWTPDPIQRDPRPDDVLGGKTK